MKFEIKNRFTGNVIYQDEAESFAALIQAAVKAGVDLHGADLHGADLHGADLHGADLHSADLHSADLHGADLHGADLHSADLHGADLHGADLHSANLYGADLHSADLQNADLHSANLQYADNIPELVAAQSNILPEGPIIGWKKCQNNIIVKLSIPAKARKSNATGRKCRAEYVKAIQVFGADTAISTYDKNVVYKKGETIRCDKWNEDRWTECGGGIHFFITRIEAEEY